MPDTISPVTREEDYLAAIAGQDVTPPDPATRKEEWLNAIAGHVEDLGALLPPPAAVDSGKVLTAGADGTASWQDSVAPTPEAEDSGKVLTAGADGTASWQTASGGLQFATEGSVDWEHATASLTVDSSSWNGTPPSGYALIDGMIYRYESRREDSPGVYTYVWSCVLLGNGYVDNSTLYLEVTELAVSQTGTTGVAELNGPAEFSGTVQT